MANKYYCAKCKNEVIDSFSSQCCGVVAVNKQGVALLNVKFVEYLTIKK